jgi:hypothetical protein
MRRLSLLGLALVGALALSIPGAFAQADAKGGAAADPGVTARSVTIGGTFPLTASAASAAGRSTSSSTTTATTRRRPCS